MQRSRLSDRSVIGLLLVALGVMFLIDTTNAFGSGTRIVGTYWPALLIIWALWGFIAGGLVMRWWIAIVGGIGIVFLLTNLNLWSLDVGQLWPVALVGIGLLMLFGRQMRRRGRRGRARDGQQNQDAVNGETSGASTASNFRSSHVFGGGKEQVTSKAFQGGEISAVFGGMEMDLRNAGLAEGEAVIDATVVCGGIELRVPRNWRVNLQTTTLFGGVEDKRSDPAAGDNVVSGELTITGMVLCGGIEVKD